MYAERARYRQHRAGAHFSARADDHDGQYRQITAEGGRKRAGMEVPQTVVLVERPFREHRQRPAAMRCLDEPSGHSASIARISAIDKFCRDLL